MLRNRYCSLKKIRKIWIIHGIENSCWKSDLDTFWQPVSGWIHKVLKFHLITVDVWQKILLFRTQTVCWVESKCLRLNWIFMAFPPMFEFQVSTPVYQLFQNRSTRLLQSFLKKDASSFLKFEIPHLSK